MTKNQAAWRAMALSSLLAFAGCAPAGRASKSARETDELVTMQFIRSATVLVTYRKSNHEVVKILVDPILADEGTEPPIDYSNGIKIPMMALPMPKERLIAGLNAVLLTHDHPDHFDREAERVLPKNTLIFCQPYDEKRLREKGFSNLRVVSDVLRWEGLTISRFLARHHAGAMGAPPFGESSSFLLQTKDESLFFTGDAILDDRLKSSLLASRPKVIVANTGECQFTKPNPVLAPGITMTLTAAELKEIARILPESTIFAVHMDAINACPMTKRALRGYVGREGLDRRVFVPNEGDVMFSSAAIVAWP